MGIDAAAEVAAAEVVAAEVVAAEVVAAEVVAVETVAAAAVEDESAAAIALPVQYCRGLPKTKHSPQLQTTKLWSSTSFSRFEKRGPSSKYKT